MTGELAYSLITDGPSDQVLLEIIDWAIIRRLGSNAVPMGQWLDPRQRRGLRRLSIADQARLLGDPSHRLLVVHRDAEAMDPAARESEIRAVLIEREAAGCRCVPLVPVRMTEAWLLGDERAIRTAADNPRGTEPLDLPPLKRLETVPDPKRLLFDALIQASGHRGRRLQKFRPDRALRQNSSVDGRLLAPR